MRVMKHLKHKLTVLCTVLLMATCLTGLIQTAAAKPTPRDQVPYLSSTSMEVGCTSKTYSVTVYNATLISSVSSTVSWMSVSKSGNIVRFTVQANNSTNNRYGSVKVTANGYTMNLSVTQWAPIFIRNSGPSGAAISYLAMDGASANGAQASRAVVFINSAGTIRVTSNASWLTISMSGHYATLNASPNYTGASRNATVTVSNGKDSKTLTVSQRVYIPDYSKIVYAAVPTASNALKQAAAPLLDGTWGAVRDALLQQLGAQFYQAYGRTPTAAEVDVIKDQVALTLIDNYFMPFYTTAASFIGVNAPNPTIYPMDLLPDGQPPAGEYTIGSGVLALNLDMLWEDPVSTCLHTFHELFHVKQESQARYNGTLLQYVYKYNILHRNAYDHNDFLESDAYHYAETLFRSVTQ